MPSFARSSLVAGAVALAAGLSACGGTDSKDASPAAEPRSVRRPDTPAVTVPALTQNQVLSLEIGTPRAAVQKTAGTPLPIADYALTPHDRRNCQYHPLKTSYGEVSYDNVWRLCFKDGKLWSYSTAPSRKAAGPDAGAPSPKDAGDALTKPGGGGA